MGFFLSNVFELWRYLMLLKSTIAVKKVLNCLHPIIIKKKAYFHRIFQNITGNELTLAKQFYTKLIKFLKKQKYLHNSVVTHQKAL